VLPRPRTASAPGPCSPRRCPRHWPRDSPHSD
jgi:hypothetical protein